jgi:hypothetical protein
MNFLNRFTKSPIDISDEFTLHLQGVNGGYLEIGNLYCFDYAIRRISDAPILEIGSFAGLSTNLISYYLRKNGKENKFFTCDKWEPPNSGEIGRSGISYEKLFTFAQAAFKRNVEAFSPTLPFSIREWSGNFFDRWRANETVEDIWGREVQLGGPLSFAFIDGDHSYESAKCDFANVDEFLEPGGFVLFDDSADNNGWECGDVAREAAKTYELIAKNPNYLLRKPL